MAEKWARFSMNDGQLYLASRTINIDIWDGNDKLGILRIGKAGVSWKVGKHETRKVRFEDLGTCLEAV